MPEPDKGRGADANNHMALLANPKFEWFSGSGKFLTRLFKVGSFKLVLLVVSPVTPQILLNEG